MATLYRRGRLWEIQFSLSETDRRTIRLGRSGERDAERFKAKVEDLVSAKLLGGGSVSQETASWLADLKDDVYAKLAKVDLVPARTPPEPADSTIPTLTAWLDRYVSERTDLKASSKAKLEQAKKRLLDHFAAETPIDAITIGHAKAWRIWLGQKDLSDATANTIVRTAKLIFNAAVEFELIPANPFRKLKSGVIAAERTRYVNPEETKSILGKLTDLRWKVLFGLNRLAGLRCPSETHILTWGNIDWQNARMTVYSPKTARHHKKGKRTVPIVPRLMAIFQDAFDAAPEGAENVVTLTRNNLHRDLSDILTAAGFTPWSDLFQTLRRSCETQWVEEGYPQFVVSEWIGHSVRVSEDHYLIGQREDLMTKAAGRDSEGAAESAAKGAAEVQGNDAQNREPVSDSLPADDQKGSLDNDLRDPATSGDWIRTSDLGIMKPTL